MSDDQTQNNDSTTDEVPGPARSHDSAACPVCKQQPVIGRHERLFWLHCDTCDEVGVCIVSKTAESLAEAERMWSEWASTAVS